jgi:hypothetical protein
MTVDPRALLMAVQERADELIEAVTRAVDTADAVEGDRPCLVGRACRAEICRDGCKWPDPDAVVGGGVEPSREEYREGDSNWKRVAEAAEARVVELAAALREAHKLAETVRVEVVRAYRGPEAWDYAPNLELAHRAICELLALAAAGEGGE